MPPIGPLRFLLAALALLLVGSGPMYAAESDRLSVLVLPIELVDTSLQGELEGSEQDLARLRTLTRHVEQRLAESGRYRVLERSSVEGMLAGFEETYAHIYKCRRCALEMAQAVEADRVLVGWVQKVSNLIRNLTIRVQDGHTGDTVAGGWTSLRGNTEEMLRRSADRVLEDHILDGAQQASGDR